MAKMNENMPVNKNSKLNSKDNFENNITEINDFNDTNIINLQQELEILRKRYDILANSLVEGVWEWDIINNKYYFSEKLLDVLGVNIKSIDLDFLNIDDFVHDDYKDLRKNTIQNCLFDDKIYNFRIEYKLKVNSGEYRYFLSKGVVERDRQNRPIRILSKFIDIHEQKIKSESLKLYEFVIHNTLTPVVWLNKESIIVNANKAYLDLHGYEKHELIGLDMSHLDNEYSGNLWKKHWAELEENKTVNLTTKSKNKDGTYIDIEVTANFVKIGDIELNCAFITDITEKLALEKKINENERILNTLIENIPIGIQFLDKNGSLFRYNKGFEDLFGIKHGTNHGYGVNVLTHPVMEALGVRGYYQEVYNEKKSITFTTQTELEESKKYNFENSFKTLIVRNTTFPILDENGEIDFVASFMEDVTENVNSQNSLIESKNRLRAVIESTKDIVFAVDTEFNYLTFNQNHFDATKAVYGSEIEIGKRMLDYVLNDKDRKSIEANIRKSFEGEFVSVIQEYGNDFKIYLEASANPIYNIKNEISGAAVFVRDVTDKIKSELALKESEQRFRKLLNDIPNIAVQGYDRNGKIVYWNKASETFYGYSENEAIGNDIHILLHPKEKVEDARKFTERLFDSKVTSTPEEFNVIRKDGSKMNVLASNAFVELSDGTLELFCIDVDLTEIKAAEQEIKDLLQDLIQKNELIEVNLEQKNSLLNQLEITNQKLSEIISEKDKLFSIIAHDLRSPLSGFMGLSKEMAENIEELTQEQIIVFAKSLQKSSENVYLLLENLLKWSQFQRGTLEFNPEVIYLKFLIENNLTILQSKALQKDIKLINNINSELSFIGDVKMFNVVLRNLLSNAIKFTPRGGKIYIGIVDEANHYYFNTNVTIYIRDTGIGIPKEIINELFSLNSNSNRTGTENEASSGLGLLLCKEFIAKHNGNIYVESEVEIGTTFFVSVPLKI